MSNQKIIIASALLLNADKELLVVRKHNSKFYMLPGGKVERSESHIETLIRELSEELHLNFQESNFTFLGQHETNAVNEKNTIVQGNIFLHKGDLDLQPIAHAELAEVRFINKLEYQQFNLAHLLKEFALPIWLNL
ncbi:NUDIX hydrolase [Sphingobacterium bovistauri]|uniref:NUDIX domain-containing protein n=1 Tax=Sphingobacterium bovistauri TaxID=2781959 RepID=A0ABS7Z419_9SPHI|nr:NUDIX domain-containing protein [Sphingobacterium bovistauri]MCA5004921.1 NUDIX domain-containing protein [Sphingobacterium bovistauri]